MTMCFNSNNDTKCSIQSFLSGRYIRGYSEESVTEKSTEQTKPQYRENEGKGKQKLSVRYCSSGLENVHLNENR